MEQPQTIVRWLARLLSVLILAAWGYFAVAHVLGDAGSPSRSLMLADYVSVAAMIVSVLGLALAWKWELAGSLLALAAIAVGAVINWRTLTSPVALVPLDAVLFVMSWRLHRWQPLATP